MDHEDSIDSQDPNLHDSKTKQKSRRPASEEHLGRGADEEEEHDELTSDSFLQILRSVNRD